MNCILLYAGGELEVSDELETLCTTLITSNLHILTPPPHYYPVCPSRSMYRCPRTLSDTITLRRPAPSSLTPSMREHGPNTAFNKHYKPRRISFHTWQNTLRRHNRNTFPAHKSLPFHHPCLPCRHLPCRSGLPLAGIASAVSVCLCAGPVDAITEYDRSSRIPDNVPVDTLILTGCCWTGYGC